MSKLIVIDRQRYNRYQRVKEQLRTHRWLFSVNGIHRWDMYAQLMRNN